MTILAVNDGADLHHFASSSLAGQPASGLASAALASWQAYLTVYK